LGYAYFEGKKAAADLKSKAFTKVAAAGAAALLGFFAYAWLTGTVVYALSEAMPLWLAALIVAFLNVVGAYLFFRKLVGGAEREKSTQAQFTLDQRVRVLQAKLDPQGNFETHPFEHGDERSAVRQGKEMMSSAKLDIGDAARDLKRAASQTVSPRYQIQHRPLPILMGGFVVGALVGLGLSGQGARKSSGWTLNLKT
jgi:hypothetical protein